MEDILTDIATGDLQTEGGDFVTGYSDEQHQEDLLLFQKGSLKNTPEVGVGLENYLNDGEVDDMLREIRFQFERDGMAVSRVAFDEVFFNLTFDAEYKS